MEMKDNVTKGAVYGAVAGIVIMAVWSWNMTAKALPDIIVTILYGLVMIPAYIADAIGIGDYWTLAIIIVIIWAMIGAVIGYLYDK